MLNPPMHSFKVDRAPVYVYPSKRDTSAAAAIEGGSILQSVLARRASARIIVGTGSSQDDLVRELVHLAGIEWSRIEVFHMDEYVGMSDLHPASFRRWLKTRLADPAHPGQVHYLDGDASDWVKECERYAKLLHSAPIDICFLGIGENGHIAFNDPGVADFHDPLALKHVALDEACRRQQVNEGHFQSLDSVPREALSLTCPELLRAERLVCCVPERRKANAVRNALGGPVTEACPASIVRTHPGAVIFLNSGSASLLPHE